MSFPFPCSRNEREDFETDYKQKYERERVLLMEENKKLSSEVDNVSIMFVSIWPFVTVLLFISWTQQLAPMSFFLLWIQLILPKYKFSSFFLGIMNPQRWDQRAASLFHSTLLMGITLYSSCESRMCIASNQTDWFTADILLEWGLGPCWFGK